MTENINIIYKYRDWNNPLHQRVLINNELYLASPKEFNDPFDCKIPPNYIDMQDNEITDFINALAKQHFAESIERGVDIDNQKGLLKKRFSNREEFQRNAEDAIFRDQNLRFGIISFSTIWDNILMWSHYANNHKGICIGFKEEKLKNTGFFGVGGLVTYNRDFPIIRPKVANEKTTEEIMLEVYTVTHTKALEWEYEKEYRLSKLFFPDYPTGQDRIMHFTDDFFAEVILGLEFDDDKKAAIIKICSEKMIAVFQIKRLPFKFGIERERIV